MPSSDDERARILGQLGRGPLLLPPQPVLVPGSYPTGMLLAPSSGGSGGLVLLVLLALAAQTT